MSSWRGLFTRRQQKKPPTVRIVKCQHDPICPNPGTTPIPVGNEIRWYCQPHAVQFRTNVVASYVRSVAPPQPPISTPRQKGKAPTLKLIPKAQAQANDLTEQTAISDILANESQLGQIPYVESGSNIDAAAAAPIQSVKTQLKYRNLILAAVTVKDSSGRRESLFVRRIPPSLEKITSKKLKRDWVVDLERAYLVLGGMRVLIWDLYNPSPILFKEVQGPQGLTIEGELIDSRKLYTIADTATLEKLVTASSAKPTEMNRTAILLMLVCTMLGFFAGGSLGPRIGLSTCEVVATTTTTATHLSIPPLISALKVWLHI
jgi:hypothetical protein